jgi:hypothetical protein
MKVVSEYEVKLGTDETIITKSPYGDEGAVYKGTLGLINHFRLQLISYRSLPKSKDQLEYLERDIHGYDLILASNSEKNAVNFISFKSNTKPRLKDNLAVIDALKANGKWNE